MTTTPIHGHEVIQMMQASGRSWTRETLRAEIQARFGPEACFYTCMSADLTADGLIDFFAARGMLAGGDAGFAMDPGHTCGG